MGGALGLGRNVSQRSHAIGFRGWRRPLRLRGDRFDCSERSDKSYDDECACLHASPSIPFVDWFQSDRRRITLRE
jgi:hypothetical protein